MNVGKGGYGNGLCGKWRAIKMYLVGILRLIQGGIKI